jgi:hypothetical protein
VLFRSYKTENTIKTEYIEIPKGMKGVITDKRLTSDQIKNGVGHFYGCDYGYSVKWNKGGTEMNIREKDINLI